jgi:NADH:ubiquinone oxidoreductase subunit 2 (subunit N)
MEFILLNSFLPEIFFSFFILSQLCFNAFLVIGRAFNFPILSRESIYQVIFSLICLFFLIINSKIYGCDTLSLWAVDETILLHKLLLIILSLCIIIIISTSYVIQKLNFFEYFPLFLFCIFSSLLLFSATDLLTVYLVIEMQALIFYILANIKTNSLASSEAGIKYFVIGAFTSAIFLLGCSLIYITYGTLNLSALNLLFAFPFSVLESDPIVVPLLAVELFEAEMDLLDLLFTNSELNYQGSDAYLSAFANYMSNIITHHTITSTEFELLIPKLKFLMLNYNETALKYTFFLYFGILCICISFFLKLAVAPFHFWAPDVYDGAPLASVIIFSILPKLPLLNFLIKWVTIINSFDNFLLLLNYFAVVSIFIGTIMALIQKNLKRLLIYSSISQTGFFLLPLANFSTTNLISLYFYLLIYLITALLLWNKVSLFYSFQDKMNSFFQKSISSLQLTSLSNLYSINPLWAFSFIIILFSIAGIPPLSGFYSKFLILLSLVELKLFIFLFSIIILSIISTFYYLRLIKIIFFEPKNFFVSNNSSLMIFSSRFLELNCFLNAWLLFLLLFFFFDPSSLLLLCFKLTSTRFF